MSNLMSHVHSVVKSLSNNMLWNLYLRFVLFRVLINVEMCMHQSERSDRPVVGWPSLIFPPPSSILHGFLRRDNPRRPASALHPSHTMPTASAASTGPLCRGLRPGHDQLGRRYVDTAEEPWQVRTFPVPQLVAAGQIEARETLPSFHYQPTGDAAAAAGRRRRGRTWFGVFAREQGALAPGRLIHSAKSWLCHSGVDRTAALLPWHGADDVQRLSPVEVTARYLAHVRAGLGRPAPAASAGRTGLRADAAGLVRRGRPRVDRQGGGPGGLAARGADRGAAGGLLRLDSRP